MSKKAKLLAAVVITAVIAAIVVFWAPTQPCTVGASECDATHVCTKGSRPPFSKAYCVERLQPLDGAITLPLHNEAGVICTQSPENPDGTHGYQNALFAIDLTSPLDGPPGHVLSVRAGVVAKVHKDCVDPGVSTNHSDDCGDGFGNHVVIDHGDGTAAFYAHLSRVEVTHGAAVDLGTPLGLEGITGRTGHRHLHFSVHRKNHLPLTSGMPWPSIDYKLSFRTDDGEAQQQWASDLRCRHNDFHQPRWRPTAPGPDAREALAR